MSLILVMLLKEDCVQINSIIYLTTHKYYFSKTFHLQVQYTHRLKAILKFQVGSHRKLMTFGICALTQHEVAVK